jgi:hypothetical protein
VPPPPAAPRGRAARPRSAAALGRLLLPHAEVARLVRRAPRQARAAAGVTHPVVLPVSSLRTSSSAARKVKDEAEEPGKAVAAVVAVSQSFRLRKRPEGEQGAAGLPPWLSTNSVAKVMCAF